MVYGSIFNPKERRPEIVAKQLSSATKLIVQLTVWK